jgi:hypothetical protein
VTVTSTKALETYWPVKDLLQGIFEILPHTPVHALSMSKAAHLELPDAGRGLLRSELLARTLWHDVLTEPRVQVLSVAGDREDERPGVIEVTVEQSQHVEGIYVVVTERIEFPVPDDPKSPERARGARDALDALDERWGPWIRRADEMLRGIEERA